MNRLLQPKRAVYRLQFRPVKNSRGFTIVETVIFLAVTGALFTSTMLLISGQQAKTEFYQAVRDVQTRIQDVANDVSTGYYHNPGGFKCDADPSGPKVTPGGGPGDKQGTNEECIFIGRAIQFAPTPTSTSELINIYNIIGLRTVGGLASGKEAATYSEAIPTAMFKATPSRTNAIPPDVFQTAALQGGIKAKYVKYVQGGAETNVAGFAFMSTLASYSVATGMINPGSLSVDIVPVKNIMAATSPAVSPVAFADNIDDFNNIAALGLPINPDGGIKICYENDGTNQYAMITLGVNRKLTSQVEIKTGTCP